MLMRFVIVFLLLAGTGFSQTFTGMIDGYYGWNFNRPTNRRNNFRAFDINHNEFSLNYAEVAIEGTANPVGFRVDIGAGDAAGVVNQFEPNSTAFLEHLQQAYLSTSGGGLTVDFGKFVTPLGAEVIETKDNWNYSRSILFNWAVPYYHFGVRAGYEINDKVTLGATVSNGWNNVKDNNEGKTLGFSAMVKPERFTWIGNYMMGDEFGLGDYRHTFDTTVTVDITDKLAFMANYDWSKDDSFGTARYQGFAAYLKVQPHERFIVSPRYEWFDDEDALSTGISQTMQEFTVTANFPVHEQMAFYTEFRRDWSDALVFGGRDSNGLPILEDNQNTLTFGVVFTIERGRN
jgi:hypothetical protein